MAIGGTVGLAKWIIDDTLLFRNAWPPLQELLVTALENTGDAEAQELALELVKKWVLNNWTSYKQSNFAMFEKYSVTEVITVEHLILL